MKDLTLPSWQGDATILVGANLPEAFCVEEIRRGQPKQPVAVKLALGWTLMGSTTQRRNRNAMEVNFVRLDPLQSQLEHLWRSDFGGIPTKRVQWHRIGVNANRKGIWPTKEREELA